MKSKAVKKKRDVDERKPLNFHVHINDWGSGATVEEVERILKPFFQIVEVMEFGSEASNQ